MERIGTWARAAHRVPWRSSRGPSAPSSGPRATAPSRRAHWSSANGADPVVRQVGEACLLDQQRAQRGTQHEGVVQALVAVRQALHHPDHVLRRAELGDGREHLVALSARGRAPWALARLWNTWTDKATGERVESYIMLALNADEHPLTSRMHKPDPQLGPDAQDKRSMVRFELEDVDARLHGSQNQARTLIRLAPAETFDAGPVGR